MALLEKPIVMTDRLFIALRSYVEVNEKMASAFQFQEWNELRRALLRRKLIERRIFRDGSGSETWSYRATERGRRAVGATFSL